MVSESKGNLYYIVARATSVYIYTGLLVGYYAPNPTEYRTHSVALRVLQILLKGTLKRRPLCRDVTNRYTLMRWQYTTLSGDISFLKRGFPKWNPLTWDDSYGVLSLQKGVQISHPITP
jgi:hypothetical protein